MSASGERRLLLVWAALVVVTLVSGWIGSRHGQDDLRSSALVTCSVLSIAAIKVRVIVREFMEVRHAPSLYRRLTDGFTVFVVGALLAIYALNLSMPPV
jgi:Prokaryotic Cytochrome C oxidase subunit IV